MQTRLKTDELLSNTAGETKNGICADKTFLMLLSKRPYQRLQDLGRVELEVVYDVNLPAQYLFLRPFAWNEPAKIT
jgi:hypothetical protein